MQVVTADLPAARWVPGLTPPEVIQGLNAALQRNDST